MVSLRPQHSQPHNPRRRPGSDFKAPCRCGLHDQCMVWDSDQGSVWVCQMGDRHLENAYRVLMSRNWEGAPEDVREEWQELADVIEQELALRELQ